MISCGGWGPYYKDFSAIASSEATRTKFSNSVVKFIREYGMVLTESISIGSFLSTEKRKLMVKIFQEMK